MARALRPRWIPGRKNNLVACRSPRRSVGGPLPFRGDKRLKGICRKRLICFDVSADNDEPARIQSRLAKRESSRKAAVSSRKCRTAESAIMKAADGRIRRTMEEGSCQAAAAPLTPGAQSPGCLSRARRKGRVRRAMTGPDAAAFSEGHGSALSTGMIGWGWKDGCDDEDDEKEEWPVQGIVDAAGPLAARAATRMDMQVPFPL